MCKLKGAKNHHPVSPIMAPKACKMQPNTLAKPSCSLDQVPAANFHTPSNGVIPRPPNLVTNNHNAAMMGGLVGRPPFIGGQGFNCRGGYNDLANLVGAPTSIYNQGINFGGGYYGMGNFTGPPPLGDGQGFNCRGGYNGPNNLVFPPTVRGSQGFNGLNGYHGLGNFTGPPSFIDARGFNWNGTENLVRPPTFKDGWSGYNGIGNLVVPPPNGVDRKVDCKGSFDGMASDNDAQKNVINSTKAKEEVDKKGEGNITCKAPPKCDPQSLTLKSSGHIRVSETPYVSKKGAPSDDLHQSSAKNDKRPIGKGLITKQVRHLLPLPPPSLRHVQNISAGQFGRLSEKKGGSISKLNYHDHVLNSDENDDAAATDEDNIFDDDFFDDEFFDEDDLFDENVNGIGAVPEQNESYQSQRPIHGQMSTYQQLGIYSNHEKQEIDDHYIVWPPMIIVVNPKHGKDDPDKDLLDYYKDYKVVSTKQSCGPLGHCGMSVLIFESSPMGYQDSVKLHEHFLGLRRGRSAWENNGRELFHTGGNLQLYGFLANKSDLDEFNKYCQEKARVKFEIKTYNEMIVAPMEQMMKDIQLLNHFKKMAAKEKKKADALKQSLIFVTEKLRQTMEGNQILRQRIKVQHEEHMEEMEFLEKFLKDQMLEFKDAMHAKGDQLKFQEERRKVEECQVEECHELLLTTEDFSCRTEELITFTNSEDQEAFMSIAEKEQPKLMSKKKKKKKKKAGTIDVQVQEEEVVILHERASALNHCWQ